MVNETREYLPLPDREAMLTKAKEMVFLIEEMAANDPENPSLLTLLEAAVTVLSDMKKYDQFAFLNYARELGIKVQNRDYPHSIKTWYEDDFRRLLEDYGDEQQ